MKPVDFKSSSMIAAALAIAIASPALAQNPTAGADAALAARRQQMLNLLAAAQTTCLSSQTTTQAVTLSGLVASLVRRVSGAIGFTQQSETIRGAARDLPPQYRLIEDDHIRACMDKYSAAYIGLASNATPVANTSVAWPEPIDVHLNLLAGARTRPARSGIIQINVQSTAGTVLTDRLAMQDPRGLAYYDARIRYPAANEVVRGTLVPETSDSYLSSNRPTITSLCFGRSTILPPPQSLRYEEFDCVLGKSCKSAGHAAGWLHVCTNQVAEIDRGAVRSDADVPAVIPAGVVSDTRQKWIVPSIASLASGNPQGVGYTIFTLDTGMFRDPAITSVTLDVDVNGMPVLEEGLEPDERPIANDPTAPLSISFALQTLDFVGAQGGCDRIGVALQPQGKAGAIGPPVHLALGYVALRDVLSQKLPVGGKDLVWSAGYVVPDKEWRALSELRSFTFAVADDTARAAAAQAASAGKAALDALYLTYDGASVVGVIRPPRTIQPNGTAAFGLAAGLVQPNGQVRFTFSQADAIALGNGLYAMASSRSDVAQVINDHPFLFQSVGAARTIPGICQTSGNGA